MPPSSMESVVLTVDVEQDCPPFLQTHQGVEEGLPQLLALFQQEGIQATFFCTGEAAERYPHEVRQIPAQGHELGCHGHSHKRFDRMQPEEAKAELTAAKRVLDALGASVISFRAPNLALPEKYVKFIDEMGFTIDSSLATYKPPFARSWSYQGRLLRIPATVTSSILRLPSPIAWPILRRHPTPVLFVHPLEFIDMSRTRVRLDCRFNTGQKAISLLREAIRRFLDSGYRFVTLGEMGRQIDAISKTAARA